MHAFPRGAATRSHELRYSRLLLEGLLFSTWRPTCGPAGGDGVAVQVPAGADRKVSRASESAARGARAFQQWGTLPPTLPLSPELPRGIQSCPGGGPSPGRSASVLPGVRQRAGEEPESPNEVPVPSVGKPRGVEPSAPGFSLRASGLPTPGLWALTAVLGGGLSAHPDQVSQVPIKPQGTVP